MVEINIKPLKKKDVKEAVTFLEKIFNTKPNDEDYPRKWFPASLEPKKNKELYKSVGATYVKYFIVRVDSKKRIIGTTGIYLKESDKKEAMWLGWMAIEPKYRGKGIGKKLVNFTINKAKKSKKKFLRLYTSNSPVEKTANIMYGKMGFKEIKREKESYPNYDRIYYELRL